ncbi:MAG: redoxin family protein [Oscillospiraceae bacterium]|nr:redoxin family protein [Oscillospiraceae bacterium]
MDNVKASWWQTHRPSKRRLIQLYCAVLYNAQVKGFVTGRIYKGNTKAVCVPGFNCYSCPGAVGACPLGALQNALGHSGNRIGFYVFGILMLYGLMLGRSICGWLCPLGLIQELLHKIPTPKLKKSRVTRVLSYLKYVILVVFAAAIPMWYDIRHGLTVPGFCKYICPAGTFEGAMMLLPNNPGYFATLGILFTRKFVIMLVIGVACVFCYRSFCRFLCPLGAIYGMFNRLALIGVKVDVNRCNGCGACVRSCGMDVRHVGDHECISCGRCMDSCRQDAISIKAGKLTLKAPEAGCADDLPDAPEKRKRLGRIIWGAALLGLCFMLLWANVLDPSVRKTAKPEATPAPAATEPAPPEQPQSTPEPSKTFESSAPIGYEVGEQLADFTIECLDGSEFRLADTRGKVVFINLWATYCGPCVQELPHFAELYHAHEGDIAMLAVHSADVTDDVSEFLDGRGWDIPFAIDSEDGRIWGVVNGSEALPQTIVLNRSGEVIYNSTKSMSPELLEQLYQQAAAAPGEENL